VQYKALNVHPLQDERNGCGGVDENRYQERWRIYKVTRKSFVPELRFKLQKSGRFRLEISVHFVPLSHINIVIFDHRSTFNNLLDKESMAIQKIKVHTVFSRGLAVAYL
jgi:hypothetical protein